MTGLTTKEIKATMKETRAQIATLVKGLEPLFKALKLSLDNLNAMLKAYNSAKAAVDKKANPKTTAKLESAKDSLTAAYNTYSTDLSALLATESVVLEKYTTLIDAADALGARDKAKAEAERDAFVDAFDPRLAKLKAGVKGDIPEFLTEAPAPAAEHVEEKPEETVEEKPEEPVAEPVRPTASATVTSVNVAPVTIDISSYVERAISATMDRLAAGMEKKIDAYLASLEIPAPVIPAPVVTPAETVAPAPAATAPAATADAVDPARAEAFITTAKANNELINHLCEEQTHIYEKLRTTITDVQNLIEGMTDLSAAYLILADRERETIEVQKQVNDMQRHIAREQQGVQVNQKLISEEQIAISAEQAVILDRQKGIAEKQASLAESQKAMEETQKALLETHMALEEAMRAVMLAQKEIIATQQAIINGNAKNQDATKTLIEKQAEITAMQKDALAAHKQLLREQKAHNEKVAPKTPKAKKPAEESPAEAAPVEAAPAPVEEPVAEETVTSPDGAVVSEKAASAPDVSSLSAEDEVRD